jgi:hypothetical protein
MRPKYRPIPMALILCTCLTIPMRGAGQQAKAQTQQSAQAEQTLESLRADLRADKTAIVTQAMNFQPGEADKFWPIYREYEVQVANLNDKRIALLKEYADNYSTLTDPEARAMAEKFFDIERDRTDLRRNYFNKIAKATSAVTAAKFFQIEHRLDLIVELNLASSIPGLFERKTSPQP